MPPTCRDRTRELTQGIWIAGIGLMMIRNRIWPDALFLVGAVRLVEAFRHPERRLSLRAGVVLLTLGVAVAAGLGPGEILILAIAGVTLAPLLASSPTSSGKPMIDPRLE